jgi:hypothetical protein
MFGEFTLLSGALLQSLLLPALEPCFANPVWQCFAGQFAGQKSVRVFTLGFMRIHGVFLLTHGHMHAYVASYYRVIHGVSRAWPWPA